MSEVYFSVDIESDGPIPGANSMLSLGAAAFNEAGQMLSTYSVNLCELNGAAPDPDTMKWWQTQPEAWEALQHDRQPPAPAMLNFALWVKKTAGDAKPVFVGYPAGFDFLFVYWYLIKFVGESPFSFSALDIKSYAAAVLRKGYREINKRELQEFIPQDLAHTHVAVEDAIEQGHMFMNLRKKALSHG